MRTLIIFQHEVNVQNVYCWNGTWPVALTPETEAWNGDVLSKQEDGTFSSDPLDEKEAEIFKLLETGKTRVFKLRSRGRFLIIQRIKLKEDGNNSI